MYDMDFGPRISASEARKKMKRELPRDARLIGVKKVVVGMLVSVRSSCGGA